MEYLMGLGVSIENAGLFVALELLQAPSLGEVTRKGFVDGWRSTGYVCLSSLALSSNALLSGHRHLCKPRSMPPCAVC